MSRRSRTRVQEVVADAGVAADAFGRQVSMSTPS